MSKKIFSIVLLGLTTLCFSSCIKQFTCTCTATNGSTYNSTRESDISGTKMTAQAECDDIKEEMAQASSGSSVNVSCVLK